MAPSPYCTGSAPSPYCTGSATLTYGGVLWPTSASSSASVNKTYGPWSTPAAASTTTWYGSGGGSYYTWPTATSPTTSNTDPWIIHWPTAEPLWLAAEPLSAGDRLRQMMQARMAPAIHSHRGRPLSPAADAREIRARATLRRVIGEDKFRTFLRDGCVYVRARGGLVYQIFPGSAFTRVYDRGREVDCLCVVLQGNFPPTDSLIVRYLMILNDERRFIAQANKQTVHRPLVTSDGGILPMEPLTETFRKLKVA